MIVGVDSPYAQWVAFLDAFAAGTAHAPPQALPALDPERLGGDVAARVVARVGAAINARLDVWHRQFADGTDRVRDVSSFEREIVAARRRLAPAWALTSSALLPADVRASLSRQLTDVVAETHDALVRQLARADRSGVLVRAAKGTSLLPSPSSEGRPPGPTTGRGRTVLVGE